MWGNMLNKLPVIPSYDDWGWVTKEGCQPCPRWIRKPVLSKKITGFWTIVVASLETASLHASAAKTAKFVSHAVGAEDCACTQELTMILGKNLVNYL